MSGFSIDWSAVDKAWDKGNDAGEGFAVGDESDGPRQAIQRDGLTFIEERGGCAIGRSEGGYFAVYDANGPWAVHIPAALVGDEDLAAEEAVQ